MKFFKILLELLAKNSKYFQISEPEKLPVEFIKEPEQKVPLEPLFIPSAEAKRPRPAYPVQNFPDKY